ncbi:hypothetical protein Tco_0947023 [Tanacetum coccineum]
MFQRDKLTLVNVAAKTVSILARFLIKTPPSRNEGEESDNPFFEGDGSSSYEWGDYGVTDDDYEVPPVFDDDQYEEEIASGDVGKRFVDNYPNFQED